MQNHTASKFRVNNKHIFKSNYNFFQSICKRALDQNSKSTCALYNVFSTQYA